MGRIFAADSSTLVAVDTTHASMLAGSQVTVGGQQYVLTQALSINTSVTGTGGLDTGVVGNLQIYFVHMVIVAGTPYLVASQSYIAPVGFTSFAPTGWYIVTNETGQIEYVTKNNFFKRKDGAFTNGGGQYLTFGLTYKTPNIPNSLWHVDGEMRLNETGVACSFVYIQLVWGAVDGTGGATPPTLLPLTFGMSTSNFGYLSTPSFGAASWEFTSLKAPTIIIPANTQFYLIPNSTYLNNGGVNGVVCQFNMRRWDL